MIRRSVRSRRRCRFEPRRSVRAGTSELHRADVRPEAVIRNGAEDLEIVAGVAALKAVQRRKEKAVGAPSAPALYVRDVIRMPLGASKDRKSTRLNSSH